MYGTTRLGRKAGRGYNPGMGKTAPTRAIALVRRPDGRGVGSFYIASGGKFQFYTFREIPCEIGGRGFA